MSLKVTDRLDEPLDSALVAWLRSDEVAPVIADWNVNLEVSVSRTTRLRDRFGPDRTAALLTVMAARRKAIAKWGPGNWLATDRGIQQATDGGIAAYKAKRIPAGIPIVDWCCGVGGEAMALMRRGPLTAIDRDRVIAAMAEHNLAEADRTRRGDDPHIPNHSWTVICDDVANHPPSTESWLNVDPDRRGDERSTASSARLAADAATFQPSLKTWMSVAGTTIGASIKLAPATMLPDACRNLGETEWISRGGTCRQQVLWLGESIRPGTTKATVIESDGASQSFVGDPFEEATISDQCDAYVYDFDPALRAAGLSGAFARANGISALGGPAGYFTGSVNLRNTLAQAFEVVWSGQADLKKIRQAASSLQGRVSEVKTRGLPWHPPTILKRLDKKKGRQLVLLASRIDSHSGAILAVRCA
ncbi:MAG: hypothetical protein R3C05_06425 [Pirellulaceae bacterium]